MRKFLEDVLPLAATYLYSANVQLEPVEMGRERHIPSDQLSQFLLELESRHALACALRLTSAVATIERHFSTVSDLRPADSRGVIRGRLNVPKYISRRLTRLSLPREYPIITTERTPEVPENSLVVRVLRTLRLQLGQAPFPRNTAEGAVALRSLSWIDGRLRRWPWASVSPALSIDQLRSATEHRLRKRQTANSVGYASLVDWLNEWRADIGALGHSGSALLVDGLLAFPVGDFFWERILEIWCLQEVVSSFVRLGCSLVQGILPLHRRDQGPIATLEYGERSLAVWFQRQEPLGSPLWSYEATGRPLFGVPDIVVVSQGYSPLLVDAKLRPGEGRGRSEEIYKMLGYLENFKAAHPNGLRAVMVFPGKTSEETVLHDSATGRLSLLVVDEAHRGIEKSRELLDASVSHWLAQ